MNQLLAELRSNPRLRWMVGAIFAALVLYGVLMLRDAVQVAALEQAAASRGITRLQAQLADREWPARVAPAKTLAVQLESRLWQAPTAGLAQAALQDWLRDALGKANVAKALVNVTVADEIAAGSSDTASTSRSTLPGAAGATTTPPELWKLRAKVGFEYSTVGMLQFLFLVESNDKQWIVERLTAKKAPFHHVEADLVAYFQRLPATQAGAAAPVAAGSTPGRPSTP